MAPGCRDSGQTNAGAHRAVSGRLPDPGSCGHHGPAPRSVAGALLTTNGRHRLTASNPDPRRQRRLPRSLPRQATQQNLRCPLSRQKRDAGASGITLFGRTERGGKVIGRYLYCTVPRSSALVAYTSSPLGEETISPFAEATWGAVSVFGRRPRRDGTAALGRAGAPTPHSRVRCGKGTRLGGNPCSS